MGFLSSPLARNPLFFAFIFPLVTDTALTLAGQDPSYWSNYATANEAAPIRFLLAAHPLIFLGASLVWYLFLYWLVKRIKHPVNLMVALGFMVGHTTGSESWIVRIILTSGWLEAGQRSSTTLLWLTTAGYFVLVGIVGGLAISSYIQQLQTGSSDSSTG